MIEPALNTFGTSAELAAELAGKVARVLRTGISRNGQALLAVSGGTTPIAFFIALSREALEWEKVVITLVDERWVDESDERSNARLVKTHLLNGPAKRAVFQPLYIENTKIKDALPLLEKAFEAIFLPFDAVVLGMGLDGHTASFFPGAKNLKTATSPRSRKVVSTIFAPAAIEPRITLTLPLLLSARFLTLHIEGDDKMRVLKNAVKEGDVDAMPIRHILRGSNELEIYWCP